MRDTAVAVQVVWAAPGASRGEVAAQGGGAVEFATPSGAYLRLGDDFVHLTGPRAPRGPLTLVIAGLGELQPGEVVRLNELPAPAPVPPLGPLLPGWRAALNAALEVVPAPRLPLAALRAGDPERAVAELAGRGEGLTPAGDDVLAGYAAWRGEALSPLAAGRASPLGLAYLRCAERGELPEVVARVVAAIRAGDAEAARRRARTLSRWGASSGAAMLWGVASAT
jgi:hypothetical protein